MKPEQFIIDMAANSSSGEIIGAANVLAKFRPTVTPEHPSIEAITRAVLVAWLKTDGNAAEIMVRLKERMVLNI